LLKDLLENKTVYYPKYFLKPFHGYEKGNMNWEAAKEGEGATISMSVNYWKNVSPEESELWLRTNYTNTIKNYILDKPDYILDVGSSFGIGTEFLKLAFNESNVQGLDLSPYFVAISSFRSSLRQNKISFIHANAEEIPLPENSLDLVTVQYLFHEVPMVPTQTILNEIYRVLKPNGTIAVIDLDPNRLKKGLNTNIFRKWAFEVTEPHIYEYYNSNMTSMMNNTGFFNIQEKINDPMNNIWLGTKI
jgi:ubiquinone/menaquinone biosynthesis C-methylase UbiE